MFDILPNLISSLLTIVFPVFASYKALRTSDPSNLSPWLMYWVSFAIFALFEFYTYFILSWIPFYAYFRLILMSYLVLPQTQGARIAYQQYIHPFLAQHEAKIDTFITDTHDRAKAYGILYIEQAIELIKKSVFGIQTPAPVHAPAAEGSYVQNLFGRFSLPSARDGLAAPAGDFYSLLSAAAGALASRALPREAQAEELSRSGILVPPHITSTAEKAKFVGAQREKLRMLLSALDKQAEELTIEQDVERMVEYAGMGDGLLKNKSVGSFDKIDKAEAVGQVAGVEGGSWMPWAWAAKDTATSSGVDRSR